MFSEIKYLKALMSGIQEMMHMPIMEATDMIHKCSGRLLFIGNGASASIASHMAADFLKNGDVPTSTFTDPALMTCIGNDIGFDFVYDKPVDVSANDDDILIAISSSGQSPNILNACETAKYRGCKIITLSGFKATNPLRTMGGINFYVPSNSYGIVEVVHTAILHCILDMFMAREVID